MRGPASPAVTRTLGLVGARRMCTAVAKPPPGSSSYQTWRAAWEAAPNKDLVLAVGPTLIAGLAAGVIAGLVNHVLLKHDLDYIKESYKELKDTLDRHVESMQKDVVDLKMKQAVQEYINKVQEDRNKEAPKRPNGGERRR